jgi:hypothetical protein
MKRARKPVALTVRIAAAKKAAATRRRMKLARRQKWVRSAKTE